MPRFLSEEWFAALADVVAGVDGDGQLALGQVVTGAPEGDVSYTILLGGEADGPRVVQGTAGASVVLVESWETARAVAAGELTAGDALAAGRVKVRGDARQLVAGAPLLASLAGAVAVLQEETTF